MPHEFHQPPVALTIAGSDCSAGAGIQADLKTFRGSGVYGLSAVTCVVAEVPGRVTAIQPVELSVVRQQIELCLEAFPVGAIKTGMLYSEEIIELVAGLYAALPVGRRPPLVVDPVMVATSGDALLRAGAVAAYEKRLFPLAALITPNLDEARVLLRAEALSSADAMRAAGKDLCAKYGVPFLMKGGHLHDAEALDVLVYPDGRTREYTAEFTPGFSTHGTGCTYSAAIAAELAAGLMLGDAIAKAKDWVTNAIHHGCRWEQDGRRTDALWN